VAFYLLERTPEEARQLLESALQSHRRGDSLFGDLCEIYLAAFDLGAGDFEAALHRCDDLLGGSGSGIEDAHLRAHVLVWRGVALLGLGNLATAENSLKVAVAIFTRALSPASWVFCHIAFLLARLGRLVDAAKTIAYIDNRSENTPYQLAVRHYEEALAIVKSGLLDSEELDRIRGEGSRLSADEVIAMAFPART